MSFPAVLHNHQYVVPNTGGTGTGGGSGAADSAPIECLNSWVDGPWGLLGVSDKDGVLTGITVRPGSRCPGGNFEIDVRCGTMILATFKSFLNSGDFTGPDPGDAMGYFRLSIAIAGIRAGVPIEARIRGVGIGTLPWFVSATFLVLPIIGDIDITTNPQRVLPSRVPARVMNTGYWTQTTAVELEASGDRYVTGMSWHCGHGAATELDIGTADTVIATIASTNAYSYGGFYQILFIAPIRVTGALRVRARSSYSADNQLSLSVVDAPLLDGSE